MSATVVVGGGGSGIGLAAAEAFAAQGDTVWIAGRREGHLRSVAGRLGPAVRPVVADLSTPKGAATVAAALGGCTVDVVIAAAGSTRAGRPRELADVADEWRHDFDNNVLTAVLLVEALRPRLARPGGRVIGISSIGAQLGSGYSGSYGGAKAALHAWVYWLAAELGSDGITANLVLPGYIPDTEFFGERANESFHAERVGRTLLGRAGTSAEVAQTIRFLASPGAGFITGQLLGVNGGTVLGR
ncbi:short-chain dehydrogenase [Micromonospora sonchi]|uniref:Short-chain dehydrogenase n=1 Tax=Micromonospora sonchi TaxID=1763543 RepID=A0A917U8T9_9ACTN|nr:SDR family oxidoreductase [Micromonospora sonchi]GGM65982.1 short-chain dehydrogenase [Micromonospora sonchi]